MNTPISLPQSALANMQTQPTLTITQVEAARKLAADSEALVSISATESWCSLGKTTISTVGGGNKPGSTTSASTNSKLKLKKSETDQGSEDSMPRRNQVFPCSATNSSVTPVAVGMVELVPEDFEIGC